MRMHFTVGHNTLQCMPKTRCELPSIRGIFSQPLTTLKCHPKYVLLSCTNNLRLKPTDTCRDQMDICQASVDRPWDM